MLRVPFLLLMLLVAACARPSAPGFPEPISSQQPATKASPSPKAKSVRAPWKPAKVVADAADVPAQRVTVAPGDTLSRIGERTGSSVQAIAQANGIAPPYVIEVGQLLDVPAGRYHTVKSGETGLAIANAYGADWDLVIAVNQLSEPYMLRVGQRLRLPTKAAEREMTLAERAAAFTLDIDDLISGGEPAVEGEHGKTATLVPLPTPPAFNGRFTVPVDGKMISRFGAKAGGLYNDGVNIRAGMGTPIRAAADGVVAYAGEGIAGFGNLVLVKHADGWVTAYAHAEDLLVIRGDTVRQGDPIARVGKTGSVDEPQLHFEIRQGRKAVDPARHLPALG